MTGIDANRLANTIAEHVPAPDLVLLGAFFDMNLEALMPGGSSKNRAVRLISELQGQIPPRDRELLQRLLKHQNAALRTMANEILTPTFVSKSGDAVDAVLLGKTAFIDRGDLRELLVPQFTLPKANTTRVLVVQGDDPGGKSYSFDFLQHLAFHEVHARATRLSAIGIPTPSELLRRALQQLKLPTDSLKPPADSPQAPREVDALIPAFKGEIGALETPTWLVIDDLNDPSVLPEIREAAFSMAKAIEEDKPQFLWIMLLGYNAKVTTDDTLRNAAVDDAEFPTSEKAAEFLEIVATASDVELKRKAQDITDLLFQKYKPFDKPPNKAAMKSLTRDLETIAQMLQRGEQP